MSLPPSTAAVIDRVPIGVVYPYLGPPVPPVVDSPGEVAIANHFLPLNGGSVNSASWPTLRDWVIANGYNLGATPLFDLRAKLGWPAWVVVLTLPDLRGSFPVGWNNADADFNAVGAKGGTKTHLLTAAESGVPAHSHPPNGAPYFAGHDAAAWKWFPGSGSAAWVAPSANMAHTGSNATADAGAAHNNVPPFFAMPFIIRAD
jgi:microcystin-dependent protein